MAHARAAQGSLSDWAPYVATLTCAGADHPLLWTSDELKTLLQGSTVREQAVSSAASAEEEYASIVAQTEDSTDDFLPGAYSILTKEAFVDALATVLARAV